jgi:hypothetical protein
MVHLRLAAVMDRGRWYLAGRSAFEKGRLRFCAGCQLIAAMRSPKPQAIHFHTDTLLVYYTTQMCYIIQIIMLWYHDLTSTPTQGWLAIKTFCSDPWGVCKNKISSTYSAFRKSLTKALNSSGQSCWAQ